ncbi:unnamed protein product [Pseudo-nitzschia multistriata]|uniref:DUF6818 domain-containing protein n=1 Tax=Pseudo-nitzschia multistriata TaxID=183589 RepID=A0A448Z775_9STRA|nr:unnamed protein product [Pseudo-nitzschia multistriata]
MSPVVVTALLYLRLKQREEQLLEALSQQERTAGKIPHTIFIPRAKMPSPTGPYATIPPCNGGRFPPSAASAPAPAVPPSGGQSKVEGSGRKAGTANYSEKELITLMTLIKEILPIGKSDWDMVVHRHGQNYPYGRSKDSIKTKFNRLRRMKTPTGNPNIPESVQLAREAHHLIGIKANIGNGEETFDPVKGFINDEDDEDLEEALTPPGAKSSNRTASTSNAMTDDLDTPIIVKKRSYGRLKKEMNHQDAVLKDYLMRQDKRDADRDKKADEREAQRERREKERDQRWLTMAETIASSMASTMASTVALALNSSNKRPRTGSHGDSN